MCTVTWFDTATNGLRTQTVTQAQLGLQPIDLLYAASLESQQALTELDDRVLLYAHQNLVPRPDSQVSIAYRNQVAGQVTFFELAPLLRSLGTLALQSRPLRPSDAAPQGSASTAMDALVRIKPARITKVRTRIDHAVHRRRAPTGTVSRRSMTIATRRGEILAEIDQRLDDFVALLVRAGIVRRPTRSWGFALDARRTLFVDLLEGVRALVERGTRRLADCDARLSGIRRRRRTDGRGEVHPIDRGRVVCPGARDRAGAAAGAGGDVPTASARSGTPSLRVSVTSPPFSRSIRNPW